MKKLNLMILAFCFALPLFAVTSEDYGTLNEQARKQNDEYSYLLYKYEELYASLKSKIEAEKKWETELLEMLERDKKLETARLENKELRNLVNLTITSDSSVFDRAFQNDSVVQTLTILNGVSRIGSNAFNGCSSLASVTIPGSVTEIGYDAFRDCGSIKAVYISDLKSWNNIKFITEWSNPLHHYSALYVNNVLVEDLIIPKGITTIGNRVFSYCSSLKSVTIPNSVTTIGYRAFYGCSSLTSVRIQEGVTKIGNSAFSGCGSLASVTIPNSVTEIEWNAFYDCKSLTDIYFKGSKKQWKKINEDEYLQKGKIRYFYGVGSKSVKLHFEK